MLHMIARNYNSVCNMFTIYICLHFSITILLHDFVLYFTDTTENDNNM